MDRTPPKQTAAKIRGFFAALVAATMLTVCVSFSFVAGTQTYLYITTTKAPFITSAWQYIVKQTGFLKQIEYFFTKSSYFKMAASYTDALAETSLNLENKNTTYSQLFLDIVRALPEDITIENFSFGANLLIMNVTAESYEPVMNFTNILYLNTYVQYIQIIDNTKESDTECSYTIMITVR